MSKTVFLGKIKKNISISHLLKILPRMLSFNSFPGSGDFCQLLKTFANSLDPDQACKKLWDQDPNCLTLTLMVFLKDFFEKVNF